MNQLIRENNSYLNKTITYTYDTGGNILNKKEYAYTTAATLGTPTKTITYGYTDANWKDKTTAYDGKTITYDAIGNPLTYDGYTYTWQKGRELATISGNGLNMSFAYNSDGLRTKKTVGTKTTEYIYSGNLLMSQTDGTATLSYLYAPDGKLLGLNYQGAMYYYLYNAQGDVVGIYDSTGELVCEYVYDSWGKVIHVRDYWWTEITDPNHVANVNPIRYRGYYYDTETGLYYLHSRYYNPEWGRFINADSIDMLDLSLENLQYGKNLYIYCDNNPVTRIDDNGELPHIVIGAGVGLVMGAAISAVSQLVEEGHVSGRRVMVAATAGAASGALGASTLGLSWIVAGGGAISAGESFLDQFVTGGLKSVSYKEIAYDATMGAFFALLGGKGSGTKSLSKSGSQAIKRTKNALVNKGLKAAINEGKKAVKYYAKSTKTIYKMKIYSRKDIALAALNGLGDSAATSSYAKNSLFNRR